MVWFLVKLLDIITNSDGGSRGNPGEAAIGVLIRDGDNVIETFKKRIGIATNNEAEYWGLISALELANQYTKSEVTCILDSELVVKQMQGEYAVRKEELKSLFFKTQKLVDNFSSVKFKHVKRDDKFQIQADKLVNAALDKA